jgi:hypothetical protein
MADDEKKPESPSGDADEELKEAMRELGASMEKLGRELGRAGERIGKEVSKSVEKTIKKSAEASSGMRKAGYVFAIIWAVAWLAVFNVIQDFHLVFIKPSFATWLPIANAMIAASIACYAVMLAYDSPWFRMLMEMMTSIFGFAAVYWLLNIYPLDFGAIAGLDWIDILVKIGLVFAMVGLGIAIVVNFIKMMVRMFIPNMNLKDWK